MYMPIWMFTDVFVFEIFDHKYRFSSPVARQPAMPWQPFCAPLVGVGVVLMVASKYKLDRDHPVLSYCSFYPDSLHDLVTMTF